MENRRTLRLNAANLQDLEPIRNFIEEEIKSYRVDASAVYDILLSVTEMATNIIVHGYQGKSGPLEIDVGRQGDTVVITLRDQAPPFDPTQVLTPDTSLPLEQRPLGGMGVHLCREFMDHMSYRYIPDKGNELILKKKGAAEN
jgi:serine/threonine-protein kinase RsbW